MDFSKSISKYMVEKRNLVKMVVLTALFSLFFINVFQPYNSRDWVSDMSDTRYFLLSSLLVLIGMCVVAVSRMLLYRYCKHLGRPVSLGVYLLWIAVELVCVSFAFVVLEKVGFGDARPFWSLLKVSLGNTALIILLPYSVLWLYFSWEDKDRRLRKIEEYRRQKGAAEEYTDMVSFFDTKGEPKLSVKASDIVYIKSADNYLTIFYNDHGKVGLTMVRSTFKSVEADLKAKGIVRCHRSYMVNRRFIKIFERGKDGFVVRLDTPDPLSLPVSRNYVTDVYELFN